MLNYKILAIDLDDTLLTNDKDILESSKQWIKKAVEAGAIVVFSTGRGLQRVERYREELQLNFPLVLVNGAEIWKKPGELLERKSIKSSTIKKLRELSIEKGAQYWGYTKDDLFEYDEWTDDMYKLEWLKFGIRHHHSDSLEAIREVAESMSDITVTSSAITNLEISYKGISKEYGITKVCQYLGVDMSDVMAIEIGRAHV